MTFTTLRIPFVTEEIKGAASYVFEVSATNIHDEKIFRKSDRIESVSTVNKTIIQLPYFNKQYTWKVKCYDINGKRVADGRLHHFMTKTGEATDSPAVKFRLRVLKNNYKDSPVLLLMDMANVLVDLDGKNIWYLPKIADSFKGRKMKSDVRVSPFGTLTFIENMKGYETDYAGNILWTTPPAQAGRSSMDAYNYHHDFKRISNGNYMVLSSELQDRKIPRIYLNSLTENVDSTFKGIPFGTIVEFDKDGNKVWEWKSSEYFTDEDIFSRRTPDGHFLTSTHLNSFYFDEKNKVVYAGFRNISKVVKIRYPEKTILTEYKGNDQGTNSIFQRQHNIKVNKAGDLFMFSNNAENRQGIPSKDRWTGDNMADSVSRLVVLRESTRDTSGYEKVWEFACDIDNQAPATSGRGGNVSELADGNYFIYMGSTPRVLIVNEKKEVLYNAIIEQWDEAQQTWVLYPQYKVNPLTIGRFDKMIYRSVEAY